MSEPILTRDRLRMVGFAYGTAGLLTAIIIAIVGFGAIDRLETTTAALASQAGAVEATLDHAASSLDDAAITATSFAGSIDEATTGLTAIEASLGSLPPALRAFEAQTATISILGERPLAGVAAQAAILAADIDTMALSVARLSSQLPDDGAAMARLGARLRTMAGDVRAMRASVATSIDAFANGDDGTGLRWLWVLVTVSLAAPPGLALVGAEALRRSA